MSPTRVTVGIDIGTSSVKAVAADDDGNVVASARVPHEVRVPAPSASSTTPTSRGGAVRARRSRPSPGISTCAV